MKRKMGDGSLIGTFKATHLKKWKKNRLNHVQEVGATKINKKVNKNVEKNKINHHQDPSK